MSDQFTSSSQPSKKRCVLCKKPVDPQFTPFCGQGCKDRDLVRWLDEGYRVEGPSTPAAQSHDPEDY